MNLLATSLFPSVISLMAMVLLFANVESSLVWRLASAVLAITGIVFTYRSLRTILASTAADISPAVLWVVNLTVGSIYVVMLWNAISLAEFWPVLLGFTGLFGIGCISFARLLLTRAVQQADEAGVNSSLQVSAVPLGISAPCKGGVFQWVQVPPGDGSLQPEAVGAIVEVTKRSKPSAMVTLGDLASLQAGI
jgi:hypothetical protein